MNSDKQLTIVVCPPYPEYKEAPEDQSESELFDCPTCKQQMWLSQKKKGVIMFASCAAYDILLRCYDCFKEEVKNDPNLFLISERKNI